MLIYFVIYNIGDHKYIVSGVCYRSDNSPYDHSNLPDALVNQPLPRITTRGETFRAAVGERIILPCQVKDLGNFV